MAQKVDLILKGGTVVNHDGTGEADIAVAGGKIIAIGRHGRYMPPPRPSIAAICISCPV